MSRPTDLAESRQAFTFKAVRIDGSEQRGELSASTRAAAREQLVASGLLPVQLEPAIASSVSRTSLPAADAALGLRLLASLLTSGLSLERTLAIFPHIAPRGWATNRIARMHQSVREGNSLSVALRQADTGLPPYVSGIIEAGEASGALAEALRDVAQLLTQSAAQRAAIRAALAYPLVLACAGAVAVGLLAGVVLPRFAELLAEVGQKLPFAARALLAATAVASHWWIVLLTVPASTLALAMHRVSVDRTVRLQLHTWLLSLPFVGAMRHSLAGSRLTSAMASMLSAGVPLATALAHGAQSTGDEAITGRMVLAREAVIRGERLSRAFDDHSVVRQNVIQLLRAGEASGEVTEMLRTSAQLEAEWGLARIRTFTAMLEPTLILSFGALIAFIAAALLQAVYAIRPVP